jgi:DNA-binding SARP family transcriptional activator
MTAVSAPEPITHEPLPDTGRSASPVPAELGADTAPALHAPPPPVLSRGQLLFRTLGAAEIHIGAGPVVGPSAERLFTLLVLTAMTPDHVLPRAQLLELVWPDLDEEGARHSLRQHLYKLKQLGVPLSTTRSTVTLDARCLVPCFALGRTSELFDRDVLRGHEPFGHLFAGWIPSSLVMRRWVEQQRDRFHMDVRRILLPELHRLRDRADWVECERWARTVLEFDPYNEDATLVLAEAIAMLGGRVNARYMLDGYVRETGVAGTDLARHVEAAQRRIGRASRVRHEHSATPTLIGRDAELQRLDALTMAAMQGESKVVHLLGPTGIGKTELAYEATRRAVILGFSRCIVRVTRPMGEVPHGMLSRLVRDLLKLPGALGCRPGNLEMLRSFAGLTTSETEATEVSLDHSLTEAIGELIASVSDEQPVVILLDEYTLADDLSLAHLAALLDLQNTTKTVWLTTSSEHQLFDNRWANDRNDTAYFELSVLSYPDAMKLAESVTSPSGRKLSHDDAERIALSSDRSPLQLVTLARHHLTSGIAPTASSRLRDTISEQIRRLGSHARGVLQCISLLGGRASLSVVDAALELRLSERVSAFRELLDTGLVSECEDGSVQCHESVTDTCKSALTSIERRILCRHTARTIYSLVRERFELGLASTALDLALQSADHSLFLAGVLEFTPHLIENGNASVALRFLEIGHDLCQDSDQKRRMLELLLQAAELSADWPRVLKKSSDLRQLASDTDQVPVRVKLAELEAAVRSDVTPASKEHAQRALQFLRSTELTFPERLQAARISIGAACDLYEAKVAISAYEALSRAITATGTEADIALEPLLQFHTLFGDLSEAVRLAGRMAPILAQADMSPDQARMVLNAAYTLRIGGELQTANAWLQRVRDSRQLQENPRRRAFATWQLSLIAADAGDRATASFWSTRLDSIMRDELQRADEPWYRLHCLRIELLQTGDIANASELLERIERERGEPSRTAVYALGLALHSRHLQANTPRFEAYVALGCRYVAKYGRYAGNDVLVAGVAGGLLLSNADGQARDILERYVSFLRRERFAPVLLHPMLVRTSLSRR